MKYKKIGILIATLWVGFILYMSSQTAVNSEHMSIAITKNLVKNAEAIGVLKGNTAYSSAIIRRADDIVRSFAHILMYFILAGIVSFFLWLWGARIIKSTVITFLLCLGISIIDEINQMGYYGRNSNGQVSAGLDDIVKDTLGILLAIMICIILRKFLQLENKQ